MTLPSTRITFLVLFLGCVGLISVGMYMQYGMGLYPCPLCITQRIFIVGCGLTGLVAFLVNPQTTGKTVFGSLGLILAILGGGFSSRQLWLQSLPPDQVPACGPALEYLLANFPLMDALSVLLRGDGDCAKVTWTFLGISIAGWTLVAFLGLAAINAWQILRKR
jgi:protein dithiol:quinone oxidoreductase